MGVGTRGGQLQYSGPAIETALTLRLLFHLPLRQTEGFLTSICSILALDLSAPDHTTLSRRGQHLDPTCRRAPAGTGIYLIIDSTGLSVVGEGEWAAAKHGGRGRRGWRKLHLGVDRSGVIIAHAVTDANVDDATTGIALIGAVAGDVIRVTADAAYDTMAFYESAGARNAQVVVPPGTTARVENAFFRYKSTFGGALRARSPGGQAAGRRSGASSKSIHAPTPRCGCQGTGDLEESFPYV